jgi:hypothetical protein
MLLERKTTLPQTYFAHCPCCDLTSTVLRTARKLLAQSGVMTLQSDSWQTSTDILGDELDQQVERKSEEIWSLRHSKRRRMTKSPKNMKCEDKVDRRVRRRHFRYICFGRWSLEVPLYWMEAWEQCELLLLLLLTAIEFSLGGSSPYTSTDKTNKIKRTYIDETIQKQGTNNTKRSKYKYLQNILNFRYGRLQENINYQ